MIAGLWLAVALGCSGTATDTVSESDSDAPREVDSDLAAKVVDPAPTITWALPTERTASPLAIEPNKETEAARRLLERVVREHGLEADRPQITGHVILAFGPDAEIEGGRPAVDAIFDHARRVDVGGETLLRFPKSIEVDGTERPLEPHTDLVLKQLSEAGVKPDRVVTVQGHEHRVADAYRYALYRTDFDVATDDVDAWNDIAWTLQGLTAWAPADYTWTAKSGKEMALDELTHATVGRLRKETDFIHTSLAAGATYEKQGQGIFRHSCGGAHLIQGAGYAVGRGFGEEGDADVLRGEMTPLLSRLDVELKQVDDMIRLKPKYRVILIHQRLKFLGHFVETVHKYAALGLFDPTPEEKELVERALHELIATVLVMESTGFFAKMDLYKQADEQIWRDIIGDSCHAIRGLDLATGVGTVLR